MNTLKDSGVSTAFYNALRENGIPPCPVVLKKINEEMRKEEPDLRKAALTICSDVGLAAGLIKTANAPYFGVRRKAASVIDALMILGLDTASQAVAGIVLQQIFPSPRGMERFWDASAQVAKLSGWLARDKRWPEIKAEEAYTFGLFRDAGIAVLMQRFPDYISVLRRANQEPERCFTDVEDEVLPTNHAVIGSLLTQSWWLPVPLCAAVRNHHNVGFASGLADPQTDQTARSLAALAQLSEYLIQVTTGLSQTREWEKLGPDCLTLLGVAADELDGLLELAREVCGNDR